MGESRRYGERTSSFKLLKKKNFKNLMVSGSETSRRRKADEDNGSQNLTKIFDFSEFFEKKITRVSEIE